MRSTPNKVNLLKGLRSKWHARGDSITIFDGYVSESEVDKVWGYNADNKSYDLTRNRMCDVDLHTFYNIFLSLFGKRTYQDKCQR